MSAMASEITSLTVVYATVYESRRLKKTSMLRITCLCEGNSLVTGELPAQRTSNAKNVSIWWSHENMAFQYVTAKPNAAPCKYMKIFMFSEHIVVVILNENEDRCDTLR